MPNRGARRIWLASVPAGIAGPRLPLRFALDIGLLETWPPPAGGPSLLAANRRLRDVLRAKGYDVTYTESSGGHGHANWQVTLPEELVALLGRR